MITFKFQMVLFILLGYQVFSLRYRIFLVECFEKENWHYTWLGSLVYECLAM